MRSERDLREGRTRDRDYRDSRDARHERDPRLDRDSSEYKERDSRDYGRDRYRERDSRDSERRDYRREYRSDRDRDRRDYREERRDDHRDRRARDLPRKYERDVRDSRRERSKEREQEAKRPRLEPVVKEVPVETIPETATVGMELRRKTRWGLESERMNIPGLPTMLPSDLTNDQIQHYIILMRIEECGRTLRIGDYVPSIKRSVSPEPTYDHNGKRNNTREMRYRKKIEDERHRLVELGLKTIVGFRPPIDYSRGGQLSEKVYIPSDDYPHINFIGLLIGPRGSTLKRMENETGTKISIRGRGSVKEGKTKSAAMAGDADDDLHCLITSDSEERIKSCIAMIEKIIQTAIDVPEGQNELKRNQLQVLAQLNGTLREGDSVMCTNCGAQGHRRFECPEAVNFTSQVVCRICNSIGHLARDCLQKNDPAVLRAANMRDQKLDEEYTQLMHELGTSASTVPVFVNVDKNEPMFTSNPFGSVGYNNMPPPPMPDMSSMEIDAPPPPMMPMPIMPPMPMPPVMGGMVPLPTTSFPAPPVVPLPPEEFPMPPSDVPPPPEEFPMPPSDIPPPPPPQD